MNLDLLEILACPACGGDLAAPGAEGPTLEEGSLACQGCERRWPVTRGIPRLLDTPPTETARNFGYEWTTYPQLFEVDRQQFLDWIHPVTPPFFEGKRVLDLGCGKGRHTVQAARFGAGRVVAVDLSEAVEVARSHTRDLGNVDVVQADLGRLPFKPGRFDYAWCVGVLHHLPVPLDGFRVLARQVRPGGHLSAWVYAREGNGWVLNLVEPLRRLMARLPLPVVRAFSRTLAWALFLVVHGVYAPLHTLFPATARSLFYGDYMLGLAEHRFASLESIVLDQLIAPTTHYVKRSDFADWFARLGLEEVRTSWLNANSWRGFARVPESGLQDEGRRARRR